MLEIKNESHTFDVHVIPTVWPIAATSTFLNVRTYSTDKSGDRPIVIESEYAETYYKLSHEEAEELIAAIQYVLMKERE